MTDTLDYQALKPIFQQALALPAAERAAWLDQACAGAPRVRAEVEALLAAAETGDDCLLDRIPIRPPPALDLARLGADRGWRVLRELARGGMGVVYLVERADGQYRQQAALKLLPSPAFADAEAVLRLRLERQILAGLNHPNIARLIDGGEADGVPYLVLEYVDGEPLDRWVGRHAPDTETRLRLFLAICDAVACAHRSGVIHRDLKPGNILVAADGTPKLLDFGIARLLDADSRLTADGERLLTPRFASPEQIRGEPVSTLSDVYSLGVVLYELLTGCSPYGDAVSAPHRLPQAICETEPHRPSDRVQRTGDEAAAAPAPARRLRGDLDAIVLRCLRKQPDQRYRSVEALAADVQAHLDGLPVSARRGERWYRLRRFGRRHWPALTTAAGVVALSLLFVAQLARQLAAEHAQRERADQVTRFLIDTFREADPRQARGSEPTVRAALARGTARLETALAGQPALLGQLQRAIASIRVELGDYDEAERLAQHALALADGQGPDVLADARYTLADVYRQHGRADDAAALLEQALAERRSADPRRLQLLNLLGNVESDRDHQDRAVALHRQAIAGAAALLGVDPGDPLAATVAAGDGQRREIAEGLVMAWHNLCSEEAELGQLEQALADCERTRQAKAALWPAEHPIHLSTLTVLANLREEKGGAAAALATERDLLATSERIYGEQHVRSAIAASNLAVSLKSVGRVDEAEPLMRRALAIFERELGAEHRATLTVRNNLGNLLLQRAVRQREHGRTDEADALGQEVLALQRDTLARRRHALGEAHPDVAESLMNLANVEKEIGRLDDAVGHAREAWALYQRTLGAQHPTTVRMGHSLAQKLLTAGRWQESLELSEQSIAFYRDGELNPEMLASAQFAAARALAALGREPARARALGQAALDGARAHPDSELLSADEIGAWLQTLDGADDAAAAH